MQNAAVVGEEVMVMVIFNYSIKDEMVEYLQMSIIDYILLFNYYIK
jgi:hypothetical protein